MTTILSRLDKKGFNNQMVLQTISAFAIALHLSAVERITVNLLLKQMFPSLETFS
jgi:hypothetical protein